MTTNHKKNTDFEQKTNSKLDLKEIFFKNQEIPSPTEIIYFKS